MSWPFLPVNPCCGCDPCSNPQTNKSVWTDSIVYNGPNLPCAGIDTWDTLTTVIEKLEEFICSQTTTTTTTLIL